MSEKDSLTKFFYPSSVLLVGVSAKEKSIGYEILKQMLSFGFTGKIFITNPNRDEILGIKCHKSIKEIDEKIDLAIILLPKHLVYDSIVECNEKMIKSIIIITAGFREVGDEGAKLEKQIIEFCKANSIRIIGPNCMGLINTSEEIKLNATFAAEVPRYSYISFLSQSGALAAAVLNTIKETGYTFGQFVSIGNKADVNENDLLEFWYSDDKTKIITMYLESFENGREFFHLTKNVTNEKPVIVVKAGRTKSGSRAALSHTGAMASEDDIVNAALTQSNCIRTETIEEMFETAKVLLHLPEIRGNKIAIITNAGGPAILCVDELEKNGLKLADLSDLTKQRLKEIVHPEGSLNNPVDMLPGADAKTYERATKIIAEDENVDALIVIFVEPVMIDAYEVIKSMYDIQKAIKKTMIIVTFPLPNFWNKWKEGNFNDAVILKSIELAPKVIKNVFHYYYTRHKRKNIKESYTLDQKTYNAIKYILMKYETNSSIKEFIKSTDSQLILKRLKLPFINNFYFNNIRELKRNLKNVTFPCVLKASSSIYSHKTEIGGVILDIKSKKELINSFQELSKKLSARNLIQKIDGYEIQTFYKGDVEVIIGAVRDKSFGPVVLFGAGGKFVEVIEDKNFRIAPLSKSDAIELIQSSKIYPILTGYRRTKTNIDELANIVQKISLLIWHFDEIEEIDLNPVIIGKKIKIVDWRIRTNFQ